MYRSMLSEVGEDLTFLKALFLLLTAFLHVSLNHTALRLRIVPLLFGIVQLAMEIISSINSSIDLSGVSAPSRLLACSEKESQSALRSFQLALAYAASVSPKGLAFLPCNSAGCFNSEVLLKWPPLARTYEHNLRVILFDQKNSNAMIKVLPYLQQMTHKCSTWHTATKLRLVLLGGHNAGEIHKIHFFLAQ